MRSVSEMMPILFDITKPSKFFNFGRLAMVLFAIPLMIMSCGTGPQGEGPTVMSDLTPRAVISPQAYFHFLRGYLAELDNEPTRAIQEYQTGLQYDSESVYLKAHIAKLYFSNGEMAAAVEVANEIQPDQIDQIPILLQLARIFAGTGKPDQALVIYDRVIELEPSQPNNVLLKGILLLSLKRFQEAKPVFEDVLAQNNRSPQAHYYLGIISVEAAMADEAERHFIEAIDLMPSYERAYRGLAGLYENQDENPKAVEVYEKYLQTGNLHHKEFRLQLVRLHLRMHSYDQALDQLGQILKDNPDDVNVQIRKALVYGEMGDYQKAIDELTTILHARPNELRVRDYLGLMYEEIKDYEHATQAYKANLEIDSTYYDSLLHLGFLSYRLKQYDEAIPYLDQAVKLNPKRSESYLLLGLTYLQTEQYLLASTRLEEGIQEDPQNADLHFNLGTVYDKLDRFDDVVREMEEALNLKPNHADALNYLGYSYADRGVRIEEALKLTRRAVELKPDNGYYVDSLGWALFKIGQIEEALETIKRAASLVEDDPVIFEHLGEIYLQQQEMEKAKEAWSRSIDLDSSNQKLINRFREQGFGNPVQEKTVQPGHPQVSSNSIVQNLSP